MLSRRRRRPAAMATASHPPSGPVGRGRKRRRPPDRPCAPGRIGRRRRGAARRTPASGVGGAGGVSSPGREFSRASLSVATGGVGQNDLWSMFPSGTCLAWRRTAVSVLTEATALLPSYRRWADGPPPRSQNRTVVTRDSGRPAACEPVRCAPAVPTGPRTGRAGRLGLAAARAPATPLRRERWNCPRCKQCFQGCSLSSEFLSCGKMEAPFLQRGAM